jgi:DNA repair protein RecN (Recombination protein N)
MLLDLTIRDFVIVDRLELEFERGFGALTGETGAGKSILVDALSLALGERADAGVVRSGRDKAEIAATFAIDNLPEVRDWLAEQDFPADGGELVLRRLIDAGGRSRAYLNGSPATVQQLRAVGEYLVDIHGQHAHQSLLRPEAQRALLDAHGGHADLVRDVGAAWKAWRAAAAAQAAAEAGSAVAARERELLAWQVQELERLAPGAREWEELEAEQRRLAHAAQLIEGAEFALSVLAGDDESAIVGQLARVAERIRALATVDAELGPALELLQSAEAEISESLPLLRRYAGRVDLDPARLREVENRMTAVLDLARKYRVEAHALPELLATSRARLAGLEAAADGAALAERAGRAEAHYRALATRLSSARAAVAAELGEAVSAQMRDLALGNGRFSVALLANAGGGPQGLEHVEFQVAGLAGSTPRPLAKVVSGGELSRISLALQVVTARHARVPTLIFDEVDVGIGGGVAEIVGRLLHALGRERQVLCVTHLPQVAARADWHWQVRKEGEGETVTSRITALSAAARIEEVARMLGGVDITATTREHARELLKG